MPNNEGKTEEYFVKSIERLTTEKRVNGVLAIFVALFHFAIMFTDLFPGVKYSENIPTFINHLFSAGHLFFLFKALRCEDRKDFLKTNAEMEDLESDSMIQSFLEDKIEEKNKAASRWALVSMISMMAYILSLVFHLPQENQSIILAIFEYGIIDSLLLSYANECRKSTLDDQIHLESLNRSRKRENS